MTQEFAKTPILGQPGKIRPSSFPRKSEKSLYSSSFLYYHFFKEKTISYHLSM